MVYHWIGLVDSLLLSCSSMQLLVSAFSDMSLGTALTVSRLGPLIITTQLNHDRC